MNSTTAGIVVGVAGWLHFCQIPAMVMAPRMLGWEEDLGKMTPINRAIFRVITLFIMFTVLGLGLIVGISSTEMVSGSSLGVGLTLFLSLFWAFRGFIQVKLYSRIWPSGWMGRISHWGLVGLFGSLCALYFVGFYHNVRVR